MLLFEHKFKEYLTEAEEKGTLQKIIDKVKSKYFTSGTGDEIKNDLENDESLADSFEEFGEKLIGDETNPLSAAYKLYKMGNKEIKSKLGSSTYDSLYSYISNKFNI